MSGIRFRKEFGYRIIANFEFLFKFVRIALFIIVIRKLNSGDSGVRVTWRINVFRCNRLHYFVLDLNCFFIYFK